MYFITEQFYQLPTEGLFSVLSTAIFGQNDTTKKEETRRQPRLLELHIAQLNQRNEERRRRQG